MRALDDTIYGHGFSDFPPKYLSLGHLAGTERLGRFIISRSAVPSEDYRPGF